MTIDNVKFFKAGGSTDDGGTTPSSEIALDLLQQLKEAKEEQKTAYESVYLLTQEERARLESSMALTDSYIAQLEYFLKTGEWMGGTGLPPVDETMPYFDLNTVDSGWYMNFNLETKKAEGDKDKPPQYEIPGTYMGTISVPASGDLLNKTALWFVATSSEDASKDMVDITGKSIGKDLAVTVTYRDGHQETWVIENGSIRSDIQVGVNALKMAHEVTMNFGQTAIIDKKTGRIGGIILIGTRHDGDKIIGSFGEDSIHGAGGVDLLNGMSGHDEVYGGAGTLKAPDGSDVSLADVFSIDGQSAVGEDGDDLIYDIDGTDFVQAGGGGDDQVMRGVTSYPIDPDLTAETEETFKPGEPADITGWVSGASELGAPLTTESKDGELVITPTGPSSTININVGDGYMLTALKENGDLVFTAVKVDGAGIPTYHKIRVKDYFNQKISLNITGGFVDMHDVGINSDGKGEGVGLNPVTITGTGKDGDILIGPQTLFDVYGITAKDIGSSTFTDSELEGKRSAKDIDGLNEVWDKEYTTAAGGMLVIDGGTAPFDKDSDGKPVFDIPLSFGSTAFVQHSGSDLLITVVSTSGSKSERVIVKVTGAPKELVIKLGLTTSNVHDLGDVNSAILPGVTIDGKEGSDLVVGYTYGSDVIDEEGFEINLKPSDKPAMPSTTPTTSVVDDYTKKIEAITATTTDAFAELDKLSAEIKSKVEKDEDKKTLQKKIDEKRAEIIKIKIVLTDKTNTAALDALQAEINKIEDAGIKEDAQKALN